MASEYIRAEDADSPRDKWSLILVLDDPGKPMSLVLALGRWEGEAVLAMRWNGEEGKPLGNPQVRGHATWFILDHRFDNALISALKPDKQKLVRTFIPQ